MKEALKWLQGILVGAASAAVAYFSANIGAGPDTGDLTLNVIVVAVLTRLAGFLASKVGPPKSESPTNSSFR